jgi:hypothetical protein
MESHEIKGTPEIIKDPEAPLIPFTDFQRLDLRIGRIIEAAGDHFWPPAAYVAAWQHLETLRISDLMFEV